MNKIAATADQKRDVVVEQLAALGYTRSSLVFATAATVNMSVRAAEHKVKNAAQEGIEKGALAHVETFGSPELARRRLARLRSGTVMYVLQGRGRIGGNQVLLLHRSAVANAQLVTCLDSELRVDESLQKYMAEWGPFLWENISSDKQYLNQMSARGQAIRRASGMTWWALQKAASPERHTLFEQHHGGVAREGYADGADDTSEDEHGGGFDIDGCSPT